MAQQQQQQPKPQGGQTQEQKDNDEAQETEVIHATVRKDVADTWWPRDA